MRWKVDKSSPWGPLGLCGFGTQQPGLSQQLPCRPPPARKELPPAKNAASKWILEAVCFKQGKIVLASYEVPYRAQTL